MSENLRKDNGINEYTKAYSNYVYRPLSMRKVDGANECNKLRKRIAELQEQVDAVKALPDKWSKRTFTDLPPQFESEVYQDAYERGQCECAKELQQALEQNK